MARWLPWLQKVLEGEQTNKHLHTAAHMKSCTLFQGVVPRSGRNWSLQTSGHEWGHQAVPRAVIVTLSPQRAQSSPRGSCCVLGQVGVGTIPNTATTVLSSWNYLWHRGDGDEPVLGIPVLQKSWYLTFQVCEAKKHLQ